MFVLLKNERKNNMFSKAFLKEICTLIIVLTALLSFCACSKNDNKDESSMSASSVSSSDNSNKREIDKNLVGKWEGNYYGTAIYLEFRDDFKGKNYASDFEYYIESGFAYVKTNGSYMKYEYHVEGDTLKWTNPHTKEVLEYSRIK